MKSFKNIVVICFLIVIGQSNTYAQMEITEANFTNHPVGFTKDWFGVDLDVADYIRNDANACLNTLGDGQCTIAVRGSELSPLYKYPVWYAADRLKVKFRCNGQPRIYDAAADEGNRLILDCNADKKSIVEPLGPPDTWRFMGHDISSHRAATLLTATILAGIYHIDKISYAFSLGGG